VEWARQLGAPDVRLILHMHMVRSLGDPAWLSGQFFARRADAILAVCEAVRRHLERVHPAVKSKLRVLHNGVDQCAFAVSGSAQARDNRRRIRREWEIPETAPVIGMVGRLDAKGQEALLCAAPMIVARCPRVHFVLVGSDGLEGQRDKLMTMAKAMGVEDRVILTGPRCDIPAVMNAFDILAHLPTDDALPGAPIEAMMAGVPVIATRTGGCPEIVRHNVTGHLVTPGDMDALVEAASDLLAGPDPAARRARFGAAGRQLAEENFSLERQGKRLVEIYSELCRKPSYRTR
jgi:glycosyltransferase involved in cell wall biosynthesis